MKRLIFIIAIMMIMCISLLISNAIDKSNKQKLIESIGLTYSSGWVQGYLRCSQDFYKYKNISDDYLEKMSIDSANFMEDVK